MLSHSLNFSSAASFQRQMERSGFHYSSDILDHLSAEIVDMVHVCISDQQPRPCNSLISVRPQHHVPYAQGVWSCHGDHSWDWHHPNSFVSNHW